jgi:hypothetical protein
MILDAFICHDFGLAARRQKLRRQNLSGLELEAGLA